MSEEQQYQSVDRTGSFRGRIFEYEAIQGKKGSINLAVKILVTGYYDPDTGAWDDTWEQYAMVADGLLNLVKNDKQLNDTQIQALVDHAGWDRSMMSIWGRSWQPTPVAFTVEENDYNNVVSLRVGFINAYDDTPGGSRNSLDEAAAKAFDAQYGPQLRALGGNTARNAATAAPSGTPPAPKTKAPKTKAPKAPPQAAGSAEGAAASNPDIPF